MILLLGGTSETGGLAALMQEAGWSVLVSTATDAPLDLPRGVVRRCGRLDASGLAALCLGRGIRVLVDASHPYATLLHEEARSAADLARIPHLRFARRPLHLPQEAVVVAGHEEAARVAFASGGPVMLTTGSRHLEPYVKEARRTGLPLLARVLDHPESLSACQEAGLLPGEIITGRGPFDLHTNLSLLRDTGARALVTKDSGEAGGLRVKAEAARLESVRLIVVRRPEDPGLDARELLAELARVER